MVANSLAKRFDKLFPSSSSLPALFVLPEPLELPSREDCTCLCATSFSQVAGESIERGVTFLFSKGISPDTLCSYRISVLFAADNSVTMVYESTKTQLASGGWKMDFKNYYPDPGRTEEWLFESAEARVNGLLDQVDGMTPERLKKTHPLLNSLGIQKAILER